MHGDLSGVVRARRLSLATVRNIKQNLFVFIYNSIGFRWQQACSSRYSGCF